MVEQGFNGARGAGRRRGASAVKREKEAGSRGGGAKVGSAPR